MDDAEARRFEWMCAVEAKAALADEETGTLVTGNTLRRFAAVTHPGSDTYAWLSSNLTVGGIIGRWLPPCPVCGRAATGVDVRQAAEDNYETLRRYPRLPAGRPGICVLPCECRVDHGEWAVANERYWPPVPEPEPISWLHHFGDRCRCGVLPTDEQMSFDQYDVGPTCRLLPCGHRPDGFAPRRTTASQESNDG